MKRMNKNWKIKKGVFLLSAMIIISSFPEISSGQSTNGREASPVPTLAVYIGGKAPNGDLKGVAVDQLGRSIPVNYTCNASPTQTCVVDSSVPGVASAANQLLQLTPETGINTNTTALAANLAVANDGVDAGNPLKMGGKAVTQNAAVSAALDRVDFQMDRWGRIFVNACGPPTAQSYVSGTISESTTPVTFAAAVASTYKDLCQFSICNSGTVGTIVTLKTAATSVGAPIPLAPAGGCYTWKEVYELTANQDWSITGTGTTGVTIQYGGILNTHP